MKTKTKHFFNLPVIRSLSDSQRLILTQIIIRIHGFSEKIVFGRQSALDTLNICAALTLRQGTKHMIRSAPYYLNLSSDEYYYYSFGDDQDVHLEPGMPNEPQEEFIVWELPYMKTSQMLQTLKKIKNLDWNMLDSTLWHGATIKLFDNDPSQFALLKQIIL